MSYRNQARRPNVDQNRFAQVPKAEIRRSTFNRSHGHKTTFDAGKLVPIFLDEVLPGDTFSMTMNGFARLATPIKPIMDNMTISTFYFFVPTRIIWDNWEKFNGAQDNPGDSTDFVVPTVGGNDASDLGFRELADYMGVNIAAASSGAGNGLTVNSLPFRAYNLIWNEWFRDQNLQASLPVPKGDGPDTATDYVVQNRAKRRDYFTSALPWPQKGDSVTIPIGDTARVFSPLDNVISLGSDTDGNYYNFQTDGPFGQVSAQPAVEANSLYADLTTATATSINQLRQAFQIQKLLERDARGGTRYWEVIKSHFGVLDPSHAVLQRPIYLGGGTTPLNVAPVAQTAASASDVQAFDTPQANLSGIGTVTWSGHGWSHSFTEHGYVIGLIQARADITYQQGLHKMWSRRTRYDFYWPALAHIGEQAIESREIYADGSAADANVFGYAERHAEYRFAPSRISGLFRSGVPQTVDIWHLSEYFTTRPVLDEAFIEDTVPALGDRVVATPEEPDFILDTWFNLKCARPMPVYGVPGMIDHF